MPRCAPFLSPEYASLSTRTSIVGWKFSISISTARGWKAAIFQNPMSIRREGPMVYFLAYEVLLEYGTSRAPALSLSGDGVSAFAMSSVIHPVEIRRLPAIRNIPP